jgi:predicted AAA+ superfamily ATPase
LDLNELSGAKLLGKNAEATMIKGAYPAIFDRKIPTTIFYRNYLETYITRDVPEVLNIQDLGQFKIFIFQLAGQAGQVLNLNAIAKDTAISPPTAKSWLSLLESSYLCFRLQPYYRNFKKRTIKSPKLYFHDTGLLCHLLGIKTQADLLSNHQYGGIFENFIISEMMKNNYHFDKGKEFWFWRDSHGKEIDLLEYQKNSYQLYEIKAGKTIKSNQFKNMNYFEDISKSKVKKHLFYNGDKTYTRSKVQIMNWKSLID